MAFTTIAASQTDSDSPVDQTLMDAIRTNLDDLNSRLGFQEALSDQSIRDDFAADSLAEDTQGTPGGVPYTWDTDGGANKPAIEGQPDHRVHYQGTSIMAASPYKMRIDLDRDHSVTMEWLWGKATASGDQDIFLGFQDASLTLVAASNTDVSDCIGFVRGTNANTIKFRTAKAGVSAETDNLSNWTNWMKLTIEIDSLSSGADLTVHAYVDDVEISGSPFTDETKIPLVKLRPYLGMSGGSGTRHAYCDYVLAYWRARPLSVGP